MTRLVFLALLLIPIVACEGPTGPAGPAGPPGPAGTPGVPGAPGASGPGTRLVLSGSIPSNGTITVDLPAAAGTVVNPPIFACYLLFDVLGNYNWVQVGVPGGDPDARCDMTAPTATSALRVTLSNATATQGYAIVVVY